MGKNYQLKYEMSRITALEIMREQMHDYRFGDKAKRGEILDLLESVLHRPRKSLIRSMNNLLDHQDKKKHRSSKNPHTFNQAANRILPRKPGRPRKYLAETDAALRYIWEAYNFPCAERLYPEIKEAIRIFARDEEWDYSIAATEQLQNMTLSSMRVRLVRFAHNDGLMRGFSTTRTSELLNAIPIFHGDWTKKPLGYGQIDTVVHSGAKLQGTMVYTVNFVEMQTYWVVLKAQLGKDADTTTNSIKRIEQELPFRLRGLHPDSGDEFINSTLISWIKKKNSQRIPEHQIELTRSRPSKKNDNCNVEERNNELVRKYIGYERYDCREAVKILNELYHNLCLYNNFFQPTYKLTKKYRKSNGQYVRQYDEPRSPFRRLLERNEISNEIKMELLKQYNGLNPRKLLVRIRILTTKLRKVQQELGYHFFEDDTKPQHDRNS